MTRQCVRPAARGYRLAGRWQCQPSNAPGPARIRWIVLDMLATMIPAQFLPRALGFKDVAPYYENRLRGDVYLALDS
jgi:putative acetyltransferase